MEGIAGARWQDEEQLHLTLRFVGEVDRRQAEDLADALTRVRFNRFPIAISGLGIFDRKGQATALWAGLQPRDELANLHRKVDRACVSIGLAREDRAYLPHITLARLNRSSGSPEAFLATHAGLSSPAFTVDCFALFESQLAPTGPSYEMMATYHADGQ
jgi:2'-5' RNA ligase